MDNLLKFCAAEYILCGLADGVSHIFENFCQTQFLSSLRVDLKSENIEYPGNPWLHTPCLGAFVLLGPVSVLWNLKSGIIILSQKKRLDQQSFDVTSHALLVYSPIWPTNASLSNIDLEYGPGSRTWKKFGIWNCVDSFVFFTLLCWTLSCYLCVQDWLKTEICQSKVELWSKPFKIMKKTIQDCWIYLFSCKSSRFTMQRDSFRRGRFTILLGEADCSVVYHLLVVC